MDDPFLFLLLLLCVEMSNHFCPIMYFMDLYFIFHNLVYNRIIMIIDFFNGVIIRPLCLCSSLPVKLQ